MSCYTLRVSFLILIFFISSHHEAENTRGFKSGGLEFSLPLSTCRLSSLVRPIRPRAVEGPGHRRAHIFLKETGISKQTLLIWDKKVDINLQHHHPSTRY